jgi:hypothetical protein
VFVDPAEPIRSIKRRIIVSEVGGPSIDGPVFADPIGEGGLMIRSTNMADIGNP